MRKQIAMLTWLLGMLAAATGSGADQVESAERGARAFRLCLACHSLEPGRHLTGPSLAGVVGRAAGTAAGFGRYSDALVASGLVWDAETLDRWLAGPGALVPGTSMRIRPVTEPGVRSDMIAFLQAAPAAGGHGGALAPRRMANLKAAKSDRHVKAIRYCGDAYRVDLGSGKTYTFWEYNLRFKSDSSPDGPPPGAPAIVPQGMQGDRAQIVFADPGEISAFIRKECRGG